MYVYNAWNNNTYISKNYFLIENIQNNVEAFKQIIVLLCFPLDTFLLLTN